MDIAVISSYSCCLKIFCLLNLRFKIVVDDVASFCKVFAFSTIELRKPVIMNHPLAKQVWIVTIPMMLDFFKVIIMNDIVVGIVRVWSLYFRDLSSF